MMLDSNQSIKKLHLKHVYENGKSASVFKVAEYTAELVLYLETIVELN